MTATVQLKIETPKPPNFLRLENGTMVRVADVPDAALPALAEDWLRQLRAVAERQRRAETDPLAAWRMGNAH